LVSVFRQSFENCYERSYKTNKNKNNEEQLSRTVTIQVMQDTILALKASSKAGYTLGTEISKKTACFNIN